MKYKRGFIGTAALIASLLAGSLHAASAVKEFTITNTGDGSMTITGAGISGNTA